MSAAADVFAVVRDALVVILEIDPATVRRETRLVEDLVADSLVLVELAELMEERLQPTAPGFVIDDADLDDLATVGELVDYAVPRLAGGA
ncbi:MAG: acyl carrier protein [Mycobacteriales bacterium]